MVTGYRRTTRRRDGRGYTPRRRVCYFCEGKIYSIDYKDVALLNRYINDRARMEPRRRTGVCARHQRIVARAIKRARSVALLPIHSSHEKISIPHLPKEQKTVEHSGEAKVTSVEETKDAVSSDSQEAESTSVEETAERVQKDDPGIHGHALDGLDHSILPDCSEKR